MPAGDAASTGSKVRATIAPEDPIRKAIEELDYLIHRANDLSHSGQLSVSEAFRKSNDAKNLKDDLIEVLLRLGRDFDAIGNQVQKLSVVVQGRAWRLDPADTTPGPAGTKLSKALKTTSESVHMLVPNTDAIHRLESLVAIAKHRLSSTLPPTDFGESAAASKPLSAKDRKLLQHLQYRFKGDLNSVFESCPDVEIIELAWIGPIRNTFTREAFRSGLKRIRKHDLLPSSRQVRSKWSK